MIWMWILACGNKEDTGTEITLEEPATFTQIEEELIKVSCAFSSCHGMGAGGLELNGEDDYERLINQPSTVLPEENIDCPKRC